LIRLGQNVQAERAERAGSLVDKYGVGTSDSITISRSAQPTPTPTSAFVVPTPNQPNNVLFAERNKITITQLYAWNRLLENGDACGSSFWKDYWYCVGVKA
ncbi:LysM domain-containing protein, partial [Pyrenophora tritici-repentis]